MNLKRRRWFLKVLKRILMGHSMKQWQADRRVFDKVYNKFMKGRVLCRPVCGLGVKLPGYRKL